MFSHTSAKLNSETRFILNWETKQLQLQKKKNRQATSFALVFYHRKNSLDLAYDKQAKKTLCH